MSEVLLRAENLRKSFIKEKKEIPVLRGINLTLNEGEMVAITGASGAGKSTLLHILGTLEAPSSGRVLFGREGMDVYKFSERKLSEFRNQSLGFVFQFHYLLPEFTALENVMMPALIAGQRRAEASGHARKLLEFMGLSERLNHRPTELSGGEQQRVAVARAVILRPKLLLADELTGNLDSENSDKVIRHLEDLHRATGISILIVTHDGQIAKRMQRVLVMKDGAWVQN
jgi:lipoprotein-releasing system ATP-binding protein